MSIRYLGERGNYQRKKKDTELSAKLNNLIVHSPWTKFSNVDNVINLSSFPLSLEPCMYIVLTAQILKAFCKMLSSTGTRILFLFHMYLHKQ